MQSEDRFDFRAVARPLRIHSGTGALSALPTVLERSGSERAFVVCGQTVAHRTDLLTRVRDHLGNRFAGVYDAIDKDSSFSSVTSATEAARKANADLLVGIGGGSVLVATRAVSIFLSEPANPYDLMTQYPEGQPAHSPRLERRKVPIVNVVTTPTSAMCRAGVGLKNDDLDHRMEYFDPKTRPTALFWDAAALMTAPVELVRSAGVMTFVEALLRWAEGGPVLNPLVEGDLAQSLRLSKAALLELRARGAQRQTLYDLCSAAFLVCRSDDDDVTRRRRRAWIDATSYGIATALHVRYPHVGQGEATTAVLPGVLRHNHRVDEEAYRRLLETLGRGPDAGGHQGGGLASTAANAAMSFATAIGMPSRLRDLDIPRDDLWAIATATTKNFNSNPAERDPGHAERVHRLLALSW